MPTLANVSIWRNTSGQNNKFFAFLGENGHTLDDGQDVAIPGDVFTMWAKEPAMINAIKYALNNGLVEILKSVDVFVYDETDDHVWRLGADNSLPVVVDPDYGSYSGVSPDP